MFNRKAVKRYLSHFVEDATNQLSIMQDEKIEHIENEKGETTVSAFYNDNNFITTLNNHRFNEVINVKYDGNKVIEIKSHRLFSNIRDVRVTFKYDKKDRIIKIITKGILPFAKVIEKRKYDENDNLILIKNNVDILISKKYDENNIIVEENDYYKGTEEKYKYDDKGNLVEIETITHLKTGNKLEVIWKDYDENNNLIHIKSSNTKEEHRIYDEFNRCICIRNSDGYEITFEYDDQGRLCYTEDNDGNQEIREYVD